MSDLYGALKEAGPYTAPLCTAMAAVIKWLVSDRARILQALSESNKRERELSEKRYQEGMESLRIMSESDKTIRESLAANDKQLDRLVERVDKWLSLKR